MLLYELTQLSKRGQGVRERRTFDSVVDAGPRYQSFPKRASSFTGNNREDIQQRIPLLHFMDLLEEIRISEQKNYGNNLEGQGWRGIEGSVPFRPRAGLRGSQREGS